MTNTEEATMTYPTPDDLDPNFDMGDEPMVRELTAYGDTVNRSAFQLVMGFAMDSLAPEVEAKVRDIISGYYPHITDSLLEDIMEDMQPEPDLWNE